MIYIYNIYQWYNKRREWYRGYCTKRKKVKKKLAFLKKRRYLIYKLNAKRQGCLRLTKD